MNGAEVGSLERSSSGALTFTYGEGWIARTTPLPLSRQFPVRARAYAGEPVVRYLDGLLPDDPRIRERVAAQVRAADVQPFDLIAALGRDCVGALQFYPDGQSPGPLLAATGTPISDAEIGELLRALHVAPLGLAREASFRISLAGAQSKTALLKVGGRWRIPTGATATTHILKPPIGPIPEGPDFSLSVENEWLCLKLMKACGLAVADATIAAFDGTRALVVERFDRTWDGRHLVRQPQEDLCQALGLGPQQKYESDGGPGIRAIMALLDESDDRDGDRRAFFQAQVLFWLIAATDGHAKNFSLAIRPGGFRLTPLYDVLSAEPAVNRRTLPAQKLRLSMAIGDNRHYRVRDVAGRHFRQTADQCGFAGIEALLEETAAVLPRAIAAVEDALPRGFPAKLAEAVFSGAKARAPRLMAR